MNTWFAQKACQIDEITVLVLTAVRHQPLGQNICFFGWQPLVADREILFALPHPIWQLGLPCLTTKKTSASPAHLAAGGDDAQQDLWPKGMEQSGATDLSSESWNGLTKAPFLWYKSVGIWQVWQGDLPERSLQALERLLWLLGTRWQICLLVTLVIHLCLKSTQEKQKEITWNLEKVFPFTDLTFSEL